MTKTDTKNTEFLDELINKTSSPKSIASTYICIKDSSSRKDPGSIETILSIRESDLSSVAQKSLSILENEETFNNHWVDFKWKLLSYLNVQDTFSATFYNGGDSNIIFRQWYFYYEAKYLILEAILCGLNGFSASLGLLLRLFLEFSLLQNYSYRKIENDRNYSTIKEYFDNKFNPNWATILKGCLPSGNFCKPIRKRLKLHLDGLSQTAAHPYYPEHSPKHMGCSYIPEQSLEGLFFPYKLSMILEPVLWMYYTNFPMLCHPVNIRKKFGFNYPVGCFIDEMGGEIIKRSISKDDFVHFYNYSKQTDKYKDLMNFYNSQADLLDEEIKLTWDSKNNGEFKSFMEGHAMQMSKLRVVNETLALKQREDLTPEIDTVGENLSFDKWKTYYKKM